MKWIAVGLLLTLAAACVCAPVPTCAESKDDPCGNKKSNVEMHLCYSKEQARVNAEADSVANELAAKFRRDAHNPVFGSGASSELRKAASAVAKSQRTWKAYRDQHCDGVMHSWTGGSGAGTAYEGCMFNQGWRRVQELRSDFNLSAPR
jgi:uncharacterized protein YecT (DUF1311 family)